MWPRAVDVAELHTVTQSKMHVYLRVACWRRYLRFGVRHLLELTECIELAQRAHCVLPCSFLLQSRNHTRLHHGSDTFIPLFKCFPCFKKHRRLHLDTQLGTFLAQLCCATLGRKTRCSVQCPDKILFIFYFCYLFVKSVIKNIVSFI